jgi:hypothetical protein
VLEFVVMEQPLGHGPDSVRRGVRPWTLLFMVVYSQSMTLWSFMVHSASRSALGVGVKMCGPKPNLLRMSRRSISTGCNWTP